MLFLNIFMIIMYINDNLYHASEPELVLVFEYCANGNLNKILQKGRPYFDSGKYCPTKAIDNEILLVYPSSIFNAIFGPRLHTFVTKMEFMNSFNRSPDIYLNFCGWHLLRWVTEIARGMEYCAFKGVISGSLHINESIYVGIILSCILF